jgi:hypothetical protein
MGVAAPVRSADLRIRSATVRGGGASRIVRLLTIGLLVLQVAEARDVS